MSPTRRKPTRRDLLVVIGRLQTLMGAVAGAASDKNPNRASQLLRLSEHGADLAIDARSYDPPVDGGPWDARSGEDDAWKGAT